MSSLEKPRTVFVCSCERSMPGFGDSVARGCRSAVVQSGDQFCGAELDRARRSFALRYHPDRMPEEMRERAALRMQIANMLIDEAKPLD